MNPSTKIPKYVSPLQSLVYTELEEIPDEEFRCETRGFLKYLEKNYNLNVDQTITHCPDTKCMAEKEKRWGILDFEQHIKGQMRGKLLTNARHHAISIFLEREKYGRRQTSFTASLSNSVAYIWPPTGIVYYCVDDLSDQTSLTVKEYLTKKMLGPGDTREVFTQNDTVKTSYHLVDYTGDMVGLHDAMMFNQFFVKEGRGKAELLAELMRCNGVRAKGMFGWIATKEDLFLTDSMCEKLMDKHTILTVAAAQLFPFGA